ncbi:hypothetical protein ACP70R_010935 [Stipagrostis hirtigluma subsp. patula]
MATNTGRPLPKFGEWDVKNPASAEGFTVIFQKARDEKKTAGPGYRQAGIPPAFRNTNGAGDSGYRSDYKSCDGYQCTTPKRAKEVVLLRMPILIVAAADVVAGEKGDLEFCLTRSEHWTGAPGGHMGDFHGLRSPLL